METYGVATLASEEILYVRTGDEEYINHEPETLEIEDELVAANHRFFAEEFFMM